MVCCRRVVAVVFVVTLFYYHAQSFLVQVPDDRDSHLEYLVNCSHAETEPALFSGRYITVGSLVLSYKQVICNGSFAPIPYGDSSLNIYYPEDPSTNSSHCVFNGPDIVIRNNVTMREYTAFLSMLWSDGYPGWFPLKCYLTLDGSYGGGDGGGGGSEPGDGDDGGGSEPDDGDDSDNGGGSEPGDGDGSNDDDPAIRDDGTSSKSPIVAFDPGCDAVERDEEHGNVSMSRMHITTDIHMSVVARCYNDSIVEFQTEDSVNYYLKVYFEIEHFYEGECVFAKSAGDTFNIRIETSWGERGDQIHTFTKSVQVSCIFNQEGRNTVDGALGGRSRVIDGFINYKGVEGLSEVVSVISLTVVNILGKPFGVQEIDLGRTIKLKAESDGGNGELGISPLTCDAIGVYSNQRYQILRAGCGDGIIIPRDKGFMTEGCVSISPYFTTFALSSDNLVRFQCNFTMCPDKCDGSTCHPRSRRSVIPAVSEEFLLDSGDL